MTIYLSEKDAARAGLIKGTRRKPAKDARPGIPRTAAGEGDRIAQLMRIAVFGFGPRYTPGIGNYFWNPQTGATTTACDSYAAACIVAEKELTR